MRELEEAKVHNGQKEERNDVIDQHQLEPFLRYLIEKPKPDLMPHDALVAQHQKDKPEAQGHHNHHQDLPHVSEENIVHQGIFDYEWNIIVGRWTWE